MKTHRVATSDIGQSTQEQTHPEWGEIAPKPHTTDQAFSAPLTKSTRSHVKFPFVRSQFSKSERPAYQWHKCGVAAQATPENLDSRCDELINQIRKHVLHRRGINAAQDEVLITSGMEESQRLLASHLTASNSVIAIEHFASATFQAIYHSMGVALHPVSVDEQGSIAGYPLKHCHYLYAIPTNHSLMPLERRHAFLKQAHDEDFTIIEADDEGDSNFLDHPLPALKSIDHQGRVIYTGSLTHSISSHVTIGYIVANATLIEQLRMQQQRTQCGLSMRTQHTAANFFALGYYESHVRRIRHVLERKWIKMIVGLEQHLQACEIHATPGSLGIQLTLPAPLSEQLVIDRAATKHILIEPNNKVLAESATRSNMISLGFSAIAENDIEQGLSTLGSVISDLLKEAHSHLEPTT